MKSQFQDIIPPERRSIRNITLGAKDTEEREEVVAEDESLMGEIKPRRRKAPRSEDFEPEEAVFRGKRSGTGLSKLVLWCITIVCVVAAFLVMTHFLSSATVTITSKTWSVDLPSHLDLSLNPTEGQVGYSTVDITDSISDTLPATGEKEASSKAAGTIIVYNNFSSAAQQLVVGTRFTSSKGLIYRLDKAITVPGTKTVAGKVTPGSIEATVTADAAGSDYNIGLDDFTIPGFSGTSKFDKFYGRSKTPMTGGNTDKIATVSDADLATKVAALKSQLDASLKDKSIKQLPPNQVIVPGLSVSTYTVGDPKMQDGKALVNVSESVKVYLLDGNTLANVLLKSQGVVVSPTDEFAFKTDSASGTFGTTEDSVAGITFAGKVTARYGIDLEKFTSEIAGMKSSDVPAIAAKYPAISEISTSIKPFWKSSIPSDTSKITVVQK